VTQVYEFHCPNCGALIQEKTLRPGRLKRCRACHRKVVIPPPPPPPLDARPYGVALAERVADHLLAGGEIPIRHPYFDGVCLTHFGGEFVYGYADAGGAPAFPGPDSAAILRRFPDRAGFVSWLAAQSDVTMNRGPEAGLRSPGEIGITRQLLESAVGQDRAEPGGMADRPHG
jgi:hypothetical protein